MLLSGLLTESDDLTSIVIGRLSEDLSCFNLDNSRCNVCIYTDCGVLLFDVAYDSTYCFRPLNCCYIVVSYCEYCLNKVFASEFCNRRLSTSVF